MARGGGIPAIVDSAGRQERAASAVERLFYDGSCALCHGSVRFVLARDPEGRTFRFAPLDGDVFRAAVPEAERAALPDSLVVVTEDGRVLTRSEAALHILRRLGGAWGTLATVLGLVPLPLSNFAYDLVARFRYRVFGREKDACPRIPPPLRNRFDL